MPYGPIILIFSSEMALSISELVSLSSSHLPRNWQEVARLYREEVRRLQRLLEQQKIL